MSENACATVFVTDENHPDGYMINESDFDEAVHKKADESEGAKKALTVPQLKEALIAKGVEIPEGAKKADLQALMDAAE